MNEEKQNEEAAPKSLHPLAQAVADIDEELKGFGFILDEEPTEPSPTGRIVASFHSAPGRRKK